MLLVPTRRARPLAVGLVALVALVAAGLSAPAAGAAPPACTLPATTQAFSRFGDQSWYFLAAGGGFEGSSLTWASSGPVTRVTDNDPFRLTGTTDAWALRFGKGGQVVSERFCVTAETPHLRFVAKAVDSTQLDVAVRVYGPDGRITDSSSGGIGPSAHRSWAPSRFVDLRTGGMRPGERRFADVRLHSQGTWLVDDVFVDPWRRG